MDPEHPAPSAPRPDPTLEVECDVEARGELDAATAGTLLALVTETATRCRVVTLDLSAVTFMDGAGVDALLAARRAVQRRGGVFRLRSPRPSVRYVLALTGTEATFEVTD